MIHKRIRQPKRTITRREAITATINAYIRNNPQEYYLCAESNKLKRKQLADEKYGLAVRGKYDRRVDESSPFRQTHGFPPKLWDTLTTIIDAAGNEPFLNDPNEEKWFNHNFPAFVIAPKGYQVPKYNKRFTKDGKIELI